MHIIKAAIKTEGGTIITGKKHAEILIEAIMGGTCCEEWIEGFVTDNGAFVTRETAARIAYEAGQTKERLERLRSQDIVLI